MWGAGTTTDFNLRPGPVSILAMIGHDSACRPDIHVARLCTRFEAPGPVRQSVREEVGGHPEGIALGVKLRHDNGSQFMSSDLQFEIRFFGVESSLAFVRKRKGNGCIECFLRSLKEQLLWARQFDTLKQVAEALEEFRQHCNDQRLVERARFQSRQQIHHAVLATKYCMTIIRKILSGVGQHFNRVRKPAEALGQSRQKCSLQRLCNDSAANFQSMPTKPPLLSHSMRHSNSGSSDRGNQT